jgi:hypothetical protein
MNFGNFLTAPRLFLNDVLVYVVGWKASESRGPAYDIVLAFRGAVQWCGLETGPPTLYLAFAHPGVCSGPGKCPSLVTCTPAGKDATKEAFNSTCLNRCTVCSRRFAPKFQLAASSNISSSPVLGCFTNFNLTWLDLNVVSVSAPHFRCPRFQPRLGDGLFQLGFVI